MPIEIPTRVLTVFEEHVPPRLLDVFIRNNNGGASPPTPVNSLIEATVEETVEDEDNEEEAEAL